MKPRRFIHGILLVLGISLLGLVFYYALWLLTDEEIRQQLLNELKVGVTMTAIETGRLEKRQQGVLCILSPRKLHEAIGLIRKADPDAFLTVTKIREVHGRGYRED